MHVRSDVYLILLISREELGEKASRIVEYYICSSLSVRHISAVFGKAVRCNHKNIVGDHA